MGSEIIIHIRERNGRGWGFARFAAALDVILMQVREANFARLLYVGVSDIALASYVILQCFSDYTFHPNGGAYLKVS